MNNEEEMLLVDFFLWEKSQFKGLALNIEDFEKRVNRYLKEKSTMSQNELRAVGNNEQREEFCSYCERLIPFHREGCKGHNYDKD